MDCFVATLLAMTTGAMGSDEVILEDAHTNRENLYPFRYSNNLVWDTAPPQAERLHPTNPTSRSAVLLKGEAGVWAPEEMLVAALNACMMLTFVAFAQEAGVCGL